MVLVMLLVLMVRHVDFFVMLAAVFAVVTSITMRVFKGSVNGMLMEVHWLNILLVIKLVIKLRMDFSFFIMFVMLHLVVWHLMMRHFNVVLLLFVVTQSFILIMARFVDNFLGLSDRLLHGSLTWVAFGLIASCNRLFRSSLNWVAFSLIASSFMTLRLVMLWHIVVVVFLLVMME